MENTIMPASAWRSRTSTGAGTAGQRRAWGWDIRKQVDSQKVEERFASKVKELGAPSKAKQFLCRCKCRCQASAPLKNLWLHGPKFNGEHIRNHNAHIILYGNRSTDMDIFENVWKYNGLVWSVDAYTIAYVILYWQRVVIGSVQKDIRSELSSKSSTLWSRIGQTIRTHVNK